MRYSAIDYTCRVCGAGTEVTSCSMTGKTLYREIPCRCAKAAVTDLDPNAMSGVCACKNPMRGNAKQCLRCGNEKHRLRKRDYKRKRRAAGLPA